MTLMSGKYIDPGCHERRCNVWVLPTFQRMSFFQNVSFFVTQIPFGRGDLAHTRGLTFRPNAIEPGHTGSANFAAMMLRLLPIVFLVACGTASTPQTMHTNTNRLANESSPYLLQHAHNPVDWYPWSDEAWEKARAENKLVIISIGYSACHWCHVMERESFEDTIVARMMNKHFVSIKVDREERPDIDQVYMSAVQLMTGQGGWPLNCVTLPDGRPVFGGTYFAKDQWMDVMLQLTELRAADSERMESYAATLAKGLAEVEIIKTKSPVKAFDPGQPQAILEKWKSEWDNQEGGSKRAPKFPMPSSYGFLMQYCHLRNDKSARDHLLLTLSKMARGGIYDQVGGGFARYSTDALWKVPHFEKMLYDNAQLINLYADAFAATGQREYGLVVEETMAFILREMRSPEGAFYSAMDADSEGEEGKFYVWTETQLKDALGDDFASASRYFGLGEMTSWENGQHILHRNASEEEMQAELGLSAINWMRQRNIIKQKLMAVRDKRPRPGLDDKILTSWNAMTVSAAVKATAVTGNETYLAAAKEAMHFGMTKLMKNDGSLWRTHRAGKTSVNANLEDYAHVIEALLNLYEATFDETYLTAARKLCEYTLAHFFDAGSGMFWFTSDLEPPLIARMQEISDNVIPASNSVMAKNLFRLGHTLDVQDWVKRSEQMLTNALSELNYPGSHGNWSQLLMWHTDPVFEVAIVGPNAEMMASEWRKNYLPNVLLSGAFGPSTLPLLKDKADPGGKTYMYVCVNKSCRFPVDNVKDALEMMTQP